MSFCLQLLVLVPILIDASHKDTPITMPHHNGLFYLDVKPANTTRHLEVIKSLTLSEYTLSTNGRKRIGFVGDNVASLVPEAVETIERRVVPSTNGPATQITNLPIVHEPTLFWYGIGAVQELASELDASRANLDQHFESTVQLRSQLHHVEQLLKRESSGIEQAQLRSNNLKAQLLVAQAELETQRVQEDQEYMHQQAQIELNHTNRTLILALERLSKEDEAAQARADAYMIKTFETTQNVERAHMEAAETLSKIKHQREMEIQQSKENIKVETAKVSKLSLFLGIQNSNHD